MKIIDEKGRLFGKINIVDFVIIVLICVIIPAFFHIYKILGKTPTRIPYSWIKVEAVTFTMPEIAELIEPGDISLDGFGNPDGKLLAILKKDEKYGERVKSATSVLRGGKPGLPFHTHYGPFNRLVRRIR